jgi:hypothetical protein
MASQYPQPMNFCNLLQVKLMFAAAMPWQTHRWHLVKWQVCNKIPGQTSKVEDPNHQSWLGQGQPKSVFCAYIKNTCLCVCVIWYACVCIYIYI